MGQHGSSPIVVTYKSSISWEKYSRNENDPYAEGNLGFLDTLLVNIAKYACRKIKVYIFERPPFHYLSKAALLFLLEDTEYLFRTILNNSRNMRKIKMPHIVGECILKSGNNFSCFDILLDDLLMLLK